MKDKLYLLKPDFMDGEEGPYYCPHSVPVEGLLSFYPQLREAVDVYYLDFPRPRQTIIKQIGEENQSLPVIIIESGDGIPESAAGVQQAEGKFFINEESEIRAYLSTKYGVGISH